VLIEHILHRKGREVETISPTALVSDAAVLLRDRNIGALVVMADEADEDAEDAEGGVTVAGILSERDVVRALGVAGADSAAVLGQPVSALMTTDVVTCETRTTVDELARLMTDRRIRHVPVLDGGELAGIVSIGDVVKSRIDELETETDTLHEYLSSGR
jgi:CBS domain-containing protein